MTDFAQSALETLAAAARKAADPLELVLHGGGSAAGLGQVLADTALAVVEGTGGAVALSDGEGKGLAFIIIAMGIVETVGIFAMVFLLGMIPSA